MDWYYANERDEQIQVSEDELKALAEGGTVKPDSLIWNETMSDWKPCREVKPDWFSPAPRSAPSAVPLSPSPGAPIGAGTGGTAPRSSTPNYLATTSSTPQPPPQPYRTAPPTDGLALASLICSIAGLAFMSCYFAGIPFSIAGVICGHLCRNRLVAQGNNTSAGLALAGLIIGYVGVGLFAIVVLAFLALIGFAGMSSSSMPTP